ncbi:hypothetical protein [Rhodopila sp.]|uniref:hypothetical protein n=1 Tax=Rhodopila sp. TaxID=2480087 RepID=UPI003D12A86E
MKLSIDVFNSRAPVWLADDFFQKITGSYQTNFNPIGGMCCFDGMVIADNRPLPSDDYRPLLELIHANSNVHPASGLVSCGPDVGCIY